MKVEEWMVKEPITVTKEHTIHECVDLMEEYSIRHLPVVENQELIGLVTARDLRQVFLAVLIEDFKIEDVMIRDPIVVKPDMDIEEAAKLIYHNKIGGLPVVDKEDRIVGIITVTDLIGAFIELMGVLRSSSRIDVILGEEPDAFERVSRLIRSKGGEVISVGISAHRQRKRRIYFFRLKKCNVKNISKALQEDGFEVVASVA